MSRRFMRIRLGPAVVVSTPALLLMAWYTWQTLFAHARTAEGTEDQEPLGVELFQLHLHDLLRRDYRLLTERASSPAPKLPAIRLHFSNSALDQLDANLPPSDGETGYVKGTLESKNTLYEIRGRYRGQKHWNWHYPQKSWKIRFEKPGRMLGHQTLLLLNSPEPEPLFEVTLLDLARERALLVPSFSPVRVLLNDSPMGLYFMEAPADEATLRAGKRFPWNLYSGNGAPKNPVSGVSQLFESSKFWTKVAGPAGQQNDLSELDRLLAVLQRSSPTEFAAFAQNQLALEDFAKLDALDVTFGIDQHNYNENQKLYFDPYRGRFQPVVWNLRGMGHETVMERAASPLSLRLLELPDYAQRRNALIWELATGEASPEALKKRLAAWDDRLASAFEQDPFWDAADVLPGLGRYYEEMVRPMDRSRQLDERNKLLHRQKERTQYLRQELETEVWRIQATRADSSSAASDEHVFLLQARVGGRAALDLRKITPVPASGCVPRAWRWRRVHPAPASVGAWKEVAANDAAIVGDLLSPGTLRVSRPAHFNRGLVRIAPDPRDYTYEIASVGCPVNGVVITGQNAVTRAVVNRTVPVGSTPRLPEPEACSDRFSAEVGGKSEHPWCSPLPHVEAISFGPGTVPISTTQEFGEQTQVTIAAGTTFLMAPGTSLIFRGKVTAIGTAADPIRWIGEQWGTVALQGPKTQGSELRHTALSGGTRAVLGLTHFPGVLSIHDTNNILLENVQVLGIKGGEDALHVAYVTGAKFRNLTLSSPSADAMDLEFSRVQASGIRVTRAKDEAIDLMGTEFEASHVSIARCGGHGVSVGELSHMVLRDALVARCTQGLLVKNSSSLAIHDVVIQGTKLGARIEQHNDWYEGESELLGERLYMRGVVKPFDLKGKPKVEPQAFPLPSPEDLAGFLRERGLRSLEDLDKYPEALEALGTLPGTAP